MQISKPTLLLDVVKCKQNIRRMANKALKNKLIFRPHFKTHQSAEISDWFRQEGVTRITVSSVSMAKYFSREGWNDIFIAFPVNLLEMDQINTLAGQINLQLSVESGYTANYLVQHLKNKAGIYIKIDTGYHRTGLLPGDMEKITKILNIIKQTDYLSFKGFYTHSGNTYSASGKSDIENIYFKSVEQLTRLKESFLDNYPLTIISIGDTPSCSLMASFQGVDEIRPGNFVFYDLIQAQLGSCQLQDIAVGLYCPIVATHKDRNEVVIYGGAIHLSKEGLTARSGQFHYGWVSFFTGNGWSEPIADTFVKSLSQEHGIIQTNSAVFNQFKIGTPVVIWPVHSCLTANLLSSYQTLGGEIIDKFKFR